MRNCMRVALHCALYWEMMGVLVIFQEGKEIETDWNRNLEI